MWPRLLGFWSTHIPINTHIRTHKHIHESIYKQANKHTHTYIHKFGIEYKIDQWNIWNAAKYQLTVYHILIYPKSWNSISIYNYAFCLNTLYRNKCFQLKFAPKNEMRFFTLLVCLFQSVHVAGAITRFGKNINFTQMCESLVMYNKWFSLVLLSSISYSYILYSFKIELQPFVFYIIIILWLLFFYQISRLI